MVLMRRISITDKQQIILKASRPNTPQIEEYLGSTLSYQKPLLAFSITSIYLKKFSSLSPFKK